MSERDLEMKENTMREATELEDDELDDVNGGFMIGMTSALHSSIKKDKVVKKNQNHKKAKKTTPSMNDAVARGKYEVSDALMSGSADDISWKSC